MLEDVLEMRRVVLACGTVDLRKGIDGLSWPRTTQEAAELTEEQLRYLMMGLNPLDSRIKDVNPQKYTDGCAKQRKFFIFSHIKIIPVQTVSDTAVGVSGCFSLHMAE